MTEYLKAEVIAQRLGVHNETINRWCRTGQLKAVKAGKGWRIRPEDLEAFLNKPQGGEDRPKANTLELSF